MRRYAGMVTGMMIALVVGACDTSGNQGAKPSPSAAASVGGAPADVAAAPGDAQKTATGVAFKVLEKGTGETRAEDKDAVRIEYEAWTPDGKAFASSKRMGRPARVSVKGVIPGLAEALKDMAAGERRRVWIPANLAEKGWPDAPKGSAITVEVKLLEIIPGPKEIPAPEDVAKPPEDAKKTKSGLVTKVLQPGNGKVHPKADETVKVHYSGWTTDGKMFDSSVARGTPASFPLGAVIAGWTEGLQLMVEGEKRRLWIPEDLAYKGMPGKPAGMLVFDVELIKIMVPPKAPPDVAKPPKDAQKTSTGLFSKVLAPGTGKEHPTATSRVKVDYTGWTTDGKMFDSSITRGQPATFSLTSVIAGWTEGLQLMVPGETRRFWIPEDLAYKGRPGKPKGMLVFDVELHEIAQ